MKWLWLVLSIFALRATALSLDREAFTFTKYVLDLRIEPDQQRIEVRGKLALRNDSTSPQKYLCLQISSSLGWRSIQIGDTPAEFLSQTYTSDVDHTGAVSEAIVTLPKDIVPHGVVELNVGYEGIIALDTTRLERIGVPKEVAKHSDWDEIGKSFTAVRGVGYVTWYPVAMESASLSDNNSVEEAAGRWRQREAQSEMNMTWSLSQGASEQSLALMCTGKTGGQTHESMGMAQVTKSNCSFSRLSLSTPAFAAGRYSILDRSSVGIYYLPEQKSGAENFALAIETDLPFVTEWFGGPRERVEVVGLPSPQSSPFESGAMFMTPLAQNNSTKYVPAAAHQLTHAAFPSARPWIYEGLAHFIQAAAIENKSGRKAALDFMGSHSEAIGAAEKALIQKSDPNVAAAQSLINTTSEEFYRSKAMYVWWMLRDMLGERAMKQALGGYRADQDNDPSYMPRLIEAQAKRDVEWFFDDWVYRDHGLPDFRVESAYPRKLVGGGYMVTVTVENLGNAGAEVPLIMKMEGGEIRKRLEVRAKSKGSIRIESVATPLEVVVNDGSVPESDMSNNSFKIVLPPN
jgi:hypothetical protein